MKEITNDKKRLLSNFFSLSVLQGLNMILPLIVLPYLVRILGVDKFGLISFVLANIMFFDILIGFGFNLSATREISLNRDNAAKVSEIFSSVFIMQIIFLLISFVILSAMVIFLDSVRENMQLYYVTFGIIVGNVMFPIWFFQGMEQMKYITYINLIAKTFFTVLIFVFVEGASDYIFVPLLSSLGAITAGAISLWIILKKFHVNLFWPGYYPIKDLFMDSYPFFFSQAATQGSRYYATTLIGINFGNVMVGYYTMVEKLYYAFKSSAGIISQVLYPYMSRTKNIIFFKKLFFPLIIGTALLLPPFLYFRTEILDLVFNVDNEILSNLFLITFLGSIFGLASTLLGFPLLAAFEYTKYANNSMIFTALIYTVFITVTIVLTKNIYFAAWGLVVSDVCSFLISTYYIHKTKIWKSN